MAYETLLEQGVTLTVGMVDWFGSFSKDPNAKKAAQNPEALLATFVAAVKQLQHLGVAVPSKGARGYVSKRVFARTH